MIHTKQGIWLQIFFSILKKAVGSQHSAINKDNLDNRRTLTLTAGWLLMPDYLCCTAS